jgi:hypothetical protein
VSALLAADPATVHTKVTDGRFLSFQLESHYQAPVTKFEVTAVSSGGNLGCSVTAEVKQPEDLHPPAKCSFEMNPKSGERMDTNWKARIVYVEFADGMRWTPKP